MIYAIKIYIKDLWINIPFGISLIAQIFFYLYILSNIHASMGQIFLHYNIIFGVDLLGPWWKIYYLPLFGLIIFIINFILSFIFYRFDRFVSRLLSFWTLFVNLFLFVIILLMVEINI